MADVLGLVLEKNGMENLDAVDTPFVPGDGTPWEQTPTRFAAFVKQTQPKSDYALYAEYLGDPKSGPTEVRWLIVKADGILVLSARQTPVDLSSGQAAAPWQGHAVDVESEIVGRIGEAGAEVAMVEGENPIPGTEYINE